MKDPEEAKTIEIKRLVIESVKQTKIQKNSRKNEYRWIYTGTITVSVEKRAPSRHDVIVSYLDEDGGYMMAIRYFYGLFTVDFRLTRLIYIRSNSHDHTHPSTLYRTLSRWLILIELNDMSVVETQQQEQKQQEAPVNIVETTMKTTPLKFESLVGYVR